VRGATVPLDDPGCDHPGCAAVKAAGGTSQYSGVKVRGGVNNYHFVAQLNGANVNTDEGDDQGRTLLRSTCELQCAKAADDTRRKHGDDTVQFPRDGEKQIKRRSHGAERQPGRAKSSSSKKKKKKKKGGGGGAKKNGKQQQAGAESRNARAAARHARQQQAQVESGSDDGSADLGVAGGSDVEDGGGDNDDEGEVGDDGDYDDGDVDDDGDGDGDGDGGGGGGRPVVRSASEDDNEGDISDSSSVAADKGSALRAKFLALPAEEEETRRLTDLTMAEEYDALLLLDNSNLDDESGADSGDEDEEEPQARVL
jgi:hypothetical protein